VFAALNAILLVVFRGNLHLVSFGEVYAQRASGGEILEANSGMVYVSSALSSVMNPLLIAYGLRTGRRRPLAFGSLGQVFVYSTTALKGVLLSAPFIVLLYYSLKKDRGGWVPKIGLVFVGTCLVVTEFVIGQEPFSILFAVGGMLLMRTYAMNGLLTAEYQYFFEHNPYTYLAHVKGISWFVHNPYTMDTGHEIAAYFGDIGTYGIVNSNAHFFAMDGITGFGLVGIPIMGIVCAVMFWVLDSCARRYPISFSASALTMCMLSLTSNSLFSTLLGGGLLVWMVLFLFMPLV
jgi:hypothetical protein